MYSYGRADHFYGQEDVVKKFIKSDIMFINVFYIPILVKNLYSMSCLCHWGWDINMKHLGKISFSVNKKVNGYIEKFQKEYII